MIIKLMTDRYGFERAIIEEREKWLEDLLLFLGIDIQVINELDNSEFVDYLFGNKIEVIEYLGMGALQVRQENEIIGEWGVPNLILKKDKGGYYYEVEIECWSIIEENINT